MRVLLTGATGFVGRALGRCLVHEGHEVVALTRYPQSANLPYPAKVHRWDAEETVPASALEGVQAVVHLAGEPLGAKRWTAEFKQRLWSSRVDGTQNLVRSLRPGLRLISVSAVGYYGDRGKESLTEESTVGQGFLPALCESWENEASRYEGSVAILRLGLVLGDDGGLLAQMVPPFRDGYGGPLGSGRQWMPWIHRRDLLRMILWALDHREEIGVFNATAPEPVTNRYFSQALANHFNHRLLPPIPALVLKVAFGEMASAMLASSRAYPAKMLDKKFQFIFPNLEASINDLVPKLDRFEQQFIFERWLPRRRTPTPASEKKPASPPAPLDRGACKALGKMPAPFLQSSFSERCEFEHLGDGTLVRSYLTYKPPLGLVGHALLGRMIKKEAQALFQSRFENLTEKWGIVSPY